MAAARLPLHQDKGQEEGAGGERGGSASHFGKATPNPANHLPPILAPPAHPPPHARSPHSSFPFDDGYPAHPEEEEQRDRLAPAPGPSGDLLHLQSHNRHRLPRLHLLPPHDTYLGVSDDRKMPQPHISPSPGRHPYPQHQPQQQQYSMLASPAPSPVYSHRHPQQQSHHGASHHYQLPFQPSPASSSASSPHQPHHSSEQHAQLLPQRASNDDALSSLASAATALSAADDRSEHSKSPFHARTRTEADASPHLDYQGHARSYSHGYNASTSIREQHARVASAHDETVPPETKQAPSAPSASPAAKGKASAGDGNGTPTNSNKISCLACRMAKRKCLTPDVNTTCRRCNAHRLVCEYREHRRGRKRKQPLPASPHGDDDDEAEVEAVAVGASGSHPQQQGRQASASTSASKSNTKPPASKRAATGKTTTGSGRLNDNGSSVDTTSSAADALMPAHDGTEASAAPSKRSQASSPPRSRPRSQSQRHNASPSQAQFHAPRSQTSSHRQQYGTRSTSPRSHPRDSASVGSRAASRTPSPRPAKKTADIHFSHVIPSEGDSSPFLPNHRASTATKYPPPPNTHGPPSLATDQDPDVAAAAASDAAGDFNNPSSSRQHLELQRRLHVQCPDPVEAGLLSDDDASELFDFYFRYLNVTIAMLDPAIHSWHECRQRSSLLFTAVLAVTSRIVRPKVYKSCLLLANKLVGEAVESGTCNIEVVQALNILAQWKKADDSSSWRRVGYAIRMAQELKLHLRSPRPLPSDERRAREVLNKERTWLNLIIADYHLAIHHSLPRMMAEEGAEDPADWITRDHPQIVTPGESVLAPTIAFSRMCRLYADMLAGMNGDSSNLRMLTWIELEWKRWRAKWLDRHKDFKFVPQQISTLKLFDAYYQFHICEYRLLYTSRYRSRGQPLDTSQPTPLSFAFGDCIDAALGLSRVFQEDFAQPGYLTYCFNLTWVSLAVTSIWLTKNITAMTSADRTRVIRVLTDVQTSTEEASRTPDDMPAYMYRLLKHLLSGVSPVAGGSTAASSTATQAKQAGSNKKAAGASSAQTSGQASHTNGAADMQGRQLDGSSAAGSTDQQQQQQQQAMQPSHSQQQQIVAQNLANPSDTTFGAFSAPHIFAGTIGSTQQMIQEDLWTNVLQSHQGHLGIPQHLSGVQDQAYDPQAHPQGVQPHADYAQQQAAHLPGMGSGAGAAPASGDPSVGIGGGPHAAQHQDLVPFAQHAHSHPQMQHMQAPPMPQTDHTQLFPSNDDDIWKLLFPSKDDSLFL